MSSLLLAARPALLRPSSSLLPCRSVMATTTARVNLSTAASATTGSVAGALTWDQFLAQRIRRRRLNVIGSMFTGVAGIAVGWAVIANIEIDPTQMILGFDPLQVLPAGLLLCGGLGALAGPSLGSLVFRASLGKNFASFNAKNAEFLRHVQRMRPDPSKQTLANPVPDYYGEKIGSLKDYRRWLRDGRAFKHKVENFL